MENLKSCPFCGGKAKVVKPISTWMLKKYHGRYVCVVCESCNVSTPLFNANNHTGSPLINKAHEESAIKKAIETWNTREG